MNGDRVCDTDPISYNQVGGVVDFTCRSGINACTGTPYSINTEKNYMNYTNCYTVFTAGQKARMQAAMSLPGRQTLAISPALGSYPVSPYAPPVASCAPVTGSGGLMSDFVGIMNVTVANRTFSSSVPRLDGGYVNKTAKCLNLISLQKNNTYNFSVTIYGQNYEQLRMWIDYDNNGVFNNATEQLFYNANIAPVNPGTGYTTLTGSFTVPATAATASVLRLRVMDELSTIYTANSPTPLSSGCANPSYGQAEDYPVYLSSMLPVKLEYFRAVKKDADALLSWKTSTEENADLFQVEKSTDGSLFELIGTVPATNLPGGATYSFTDKHMNAPVNYYRLRQVDKDLKAQESNVIAVTNPAEAKSRFKVINNPFDNQLDVVLTGNATTASTINMFDATGRKLLSRVYKVADGQVLHLDVSAISLKPGMYFLQAQVGNEVFTQKVIKQ